MGDMSGAAALLGTALEGTTVLECGDARAELAGVLLASMGADVIRLEGPHGSHSRHVGPFTTPTPDPEHSLTFSRYNLGKRSVRLDTERPEGRAAFERIARRANVILDSGEAAEVARRLAGYRDLRKSDPKLVVCTITPFGLDGPSRDLKMTDLTHLAFGGVMASCGYDPRRDGVYDTPPIAPAMWQAYHIASEHAVIAILAALNFCEIAGAGDLIDLSIHEAVSTCTEVAIPTYIYEHAIVRRQTGRHAAEKPSRPWLRATKDGRYVKAFLFWGGRERRVIAELMTEAGIDHDLDSDAYRELAERSPSEAGAHFSAMIDRLCAALTAEEIFHRAQAKGLLWASVRYPEENLADPHFQARGTFQPFAHPELGRELQYPVSVATDGANRVTSFRRGAPRLGEHTREVLQEAGLTIPEIDALAKGGVS
jgi:crotonobetainyl-CoA:carnitine CoA-transferase CaiB-like acyl-CoA transferase